MKIKYRSIKLLSIILLLSIALNFTACSVKNDNSINFSDESGITISIGMKKSSVEKMFGRAFKNDTYYYLGDQYIALGFIANKLSYIQFNDVWTVSDGLQCKDKIADLISLLGEPAGEASSENRTVINRLDYVFDNTKIEYYAIDGENIYALVCTDKDIDISSIQKSMSDYYQNAINVK